MAKPAKAIENGVIESTATDKINMLINIYPLHNQTGL
jgi:hypothetical protein